MPLLVSFSSTDYLATDEEVSGSGGNSFSFDYYDSNVEMSGYEASPALSVPQKA